MNKPKTVEEVAFVNAFEVLATERRLRELRVQEQEALTEKAQIELRTQKVILEATEEHRRAMDLPAVKFS